MGFAILRTEKLKHAVAVRRSLMHSFRTQDTPNADPSRTPNNTVIGADSVEAAMQRFNERLATQPKIRSNAVLAIEYLIAASPESIHAKSREEQDAYFADALKWIEEKHGAENVIAAGIHRDETSPHMYLQVVPLDKRGKLNCRAFLGGSDALRQMQTEFAERVGRPHDLQRGIEGSKARHTTIKQYYARANAAFESLPRLTTPKPKQKAPEPPQKPWAFASQATKDQYEIDLASWKRQKAADDKAIKERKDFNSAARALVETYAVQASEYKATKTMLDKARDMGAYLGRSARKLQIEVEALRETVTLFTPEEIEAAQKRARATAAAHERQILLDTQKQLEALETASRQEAEARRSKEIEQEQEPRQEPQRDDDNDPGF